MSRLATGEFQVSRGDVGNVVVQKTVSRRGNTFQIIAQEAKDHRNVMGGETPENVFLGAEPSEVESVGIDILNLAESTRLAK